MTPSDQSSGPAFARRIIEKYVSSQSNVFLIHGNTRDVHALGDDRYVPLVDFLIDALLKPQSEILPRVVIVYDPAEGISFVNPLDRQIVEDYLGRDRLDQIVRSSRQDVMFALAALRELTWAGGSSRLGTTVLPTLGKDLAIIVRHGEVVAPAASGELMADYDRFKVAALENWFSDSTFVASRNIVFLIAETLSGVNQRIIDLPYCCAIRIDRPSEDERGKYVKFLLQKEPVQTAVPVEHIAGRSAGLTLLSLRQIFLQASFQGVAVTSESLFEKTKEILEKELEGYIEFPNLRYGFEQIVGATRLLKKLGELRDCLRGGDPDLMPVGILVPGANGVGKTFILKAFAKECGWVAVILKNLRGQYVGQTERNWEKVRTVLESMGNVMVLYDEADTEIGGRGRETHDVDRRLFGNILKIMSEPANKGRIVWIIITARPDRLEPDIKRSGRAGEHLPVFDNEGADKEAFFAHVLGKAGIDLAGFPDALRQRFLKGTEGYYPADFDQIVTELKRRRAREGGTLTPEMVLEEVDDFIPSDIARQREYQELLAVLECTSRELLPDRYANLSREEVQQRVQDIRALLG
jgi:AAA+ superfamily predicted ATPase